MKLTFLVLSGILGLYPPTQAQKTEIVFEVDFKGEKIGLLRAVEERDGNKVIKDLKTETNTKILVIAIHVETEVQINKEDDILMEGKAYRHSNRGTEDVHARTSRIGDKSYQLECNGKKSNYNEDITICMIDMYFKEPLGITSVFSNMYAQKLELKLMRPGKYQLMTPDNKNSYFTYENGMLMTVESETPVGKIVSKRL